MPTPKRLIIKSSSLSNQLISTSSLHSMPYSLYYYPCSSDIKAVPLLLSFKEVSAALVPSVMEKDLKEVARGTESR